MSQSIERRAFERFATAPMYTTISARTLDELNFTRHGHAYDISEGGVRFELDAGIDPGTAVAVQISLPAAAMEAGDIGPGRAIFVIGNVVWCDDGEPGPCKLAVAFTRFARTGDRERLLRPFQTRSLRRVA
jgi:hypothetical protein